MSKSEIETLERDVEDFLEHASPDELNAFVEEGTDSAMSRFRSRLRLLPRALSTSPRWLTMINPIAGLIMKGVQTRGTARSGEPGCGTRWSWCSR